MSTDLTLILQHIERAGRIASVSGATPFLFLIHLPPQCEFDPAAAKAFYESGGAPHLQREYVELGYQAIEQGYVHAIRDITEILGFVKPN